MNPTDSVHNSLAEIPENRLVDRIVTDRLWGREFFHLYGMPTGMVSRQCVPLAGAPGDIEGDIDVLFCAPDIPERAVAYQIKRIKFGVNQLRNGIPSKLKEFKKLAQQTNLISRMGFWQVYAYLVVVVDAREQNAGDQKAGKLTFHGLSSELQSQVDSAVSSASALFDGRVGIGLMQFEQTMDSEPFTVGTHGLQIRRFCEAARQGEELTNWVAENSSNSVPRKQDAGGPSID